MALFAGAELRPGDQVAVEFTPPFSSPPIRVDAKICNRAGYHYGVEFLAVDSAQRQSVAQLRHASGEFYHRGLKARTRASQNGGLSSCPARMVCRSARKLRNISSLSGVASTNSCLA